MRCDSPETLLLAQADPLGRAATRLLQLMTVEARLRYPEEWIPGTPAPRNQPLGPRSAFLIARLGRRVIGCGGIRPLDNDAAELRRMYVIRNSRQRGVARALLHETESLARGFGYCVIRLATGVRQPEAMALYESQGYVRAMPYGSYGCDPLSVCYEKRLHDAALGARV